MSFLPEDLQDLIDRDNARLSNFDDRLVEQACRLVQHLATFDIPTTLSVSSSGLSVSVPSDAIGQLEASMGDVELYEVPDPPNYVHQGYKLYRHADGGYEAEVFLDDWKERTATVWLTYGPVAAARWANVIRRVARWARKSL